MTGHVYKKKRPVGADEERVIMHEGDASSSVTSCESDHIDRVDLCSRSRTFRQSLAAFVQSAKFQVLVVSLVAFDCLVVVVALLIDLRVFQTGQPDRTASTVLHHINVAVLGLFVIEMAVKAAAWGARLIKERGEMLDGIVVVAAFALGMALPTDNTTHGVSLIIMLRLWRITKILNGVIADVKQEGARRVAKERRSRKAMEREVYKLREYCLQQECELQIYRMLLQQNGIPQPTLLRAPPEPRTLNVVAEVNEQGLVRGTSPAVARSPPSSRSASPNSAATV